MTTRFAIEHTTTYRYASSVSNTVQMLRLTPRSEVHQRTLDWQLFAPGRLEQQFDAFGNSTHMLSLHRPHDVIEVKVRGTVELSTLTNGLISSEEGAIPALAFGVVTPLTQPNQDITTFAHQTVPSGLRDPSDCLLLAATIADRVSYLAGVTEVTSTAAQAFEMQQGVCQDHAHVFLACCRVLNTPARYVSGYVHPGTANYAASHAWVDVWIEGLGWISVDITNRQLTSDKHCRLAVARDYESAAPIRGVRVGGGRESMTVQVQFHNDNQ
jgi:transglutaminase-like putative cysteine protease